MKSFSFTFSSKEKVKLICKRSKDVDRGRNLSYNLFKPSSPSPLGRNFKENHFENYIFLNIFVKLQTSKKSILKTTFVLNFKANHLKTFFFYIFVKSSLRLAHRFKLQRQISDVVHLYCSNKIV